MLVFVSRRCFAFAELPWYQRKVAAVIFASPPTATYEEVKEMTRFHTGWTNVWNVTLSDVLSYICICPFNKQLKWDVFPLCPSGSGVLLEGRGRYRMYQDISVILEWLRHIYVHLLTSLLSVDPNFYSKNLLMLGKTYMMLRDHKRAATWLQKVRDFPALTEEDKQVNDSHSIISVCLIFFRCVMQMFDLAQVHKEALDLLKKLKGWVGTPKKSSTDSECVWYKFVIY